MSANTENPIIKSAILVFILASFGLPVVNAAEYGSEHQGFMKVQQALDYAEFQFVVNNETTAVCQRRSEKPINSPV
jgi:hypothetical protein